MSSPSVTEDGWKLPYSCKTCGISTSTLHRWNTTLESRTRRMTPKRKRKLTLVVVDKIKQLLVESNGVLTLNHIQLHLEQFGQPFVSPDHISCSETFMRIFKEASGETVWWEKGPRRAETPCRCIRTNHPSTHTRGSWRASGPYDWKYLLVAPCRKLPEGRPPGAGHPG